MKQLSRYLIVVFSIAATPIISASEWQLNGFVGQGYIAAEDTQFIVGEEHSTFDITEAAFAASWKPIEHFRFASALSFRQWGTLAEAGVDFDYLFAEYSHHVGEGSIGARVGRFKNETGFYSSTRDVPFTRPSIMLPQSIYSDYFRDAHLHVEGLDVFGSHLVLDGTLDWHASIGKVDVTENLELNVMGSEALGAFDSEQFYSADIEFENDHFRLGVTFFDAEVSYQPVDGTSYYSGDIRLKNWIFSGQFRYKMFEMTGEYMMSERLINGLVIPSNAGELVDSGLGYYLDLRAYLPHEVELFVRFDKHIDNEDDPDGTQSEVGTGLPAYFGYTNDWTVGARLLWKHNWLLSAEFHQIEGASWVTPIVAPDPMTQSKRWSMLALQVSYRFQW